MNIDMSRKPLSSLTLVALLTAAAAPAAFAAPPRTAFVREQALSLLEDALTPDQTTTLQILAYQSAIANVCEGFDIDDAKFATAFGTLAPVDAARMTDAQKAYHDQHLLVIFGVLVGGEFGAIADDPAAACEQAGVAKADADMGPGLVWR
jgi:hypothetical protein